MNTRQGWAATHDRRPRDTSGVSVTRGCDVSGKANTNGVEMGPMCHRHVVKVRLHWMRCVAVRQRLAVCGKNYTTCRTMPQRNATQRTASGVNEPLRSQLFVDYLSSPDRETDRGGV